MWIVYILLVYPHVLPCACTPRWIVYLFLVCPHVLPHEQYPRWGLYIYIYIYIYYVILKTPAASHRRPPPLWTVLTCDPQEMKRVSKLAQRVQRECTGYFCGYTFKGQPVGRKYLRLAAESSNYLEDILKDKSAKSLSHMIWESKIDPKINANMH